MADKENMNAKCYCGHSLASHMKDGGPCSSCDCRTFTEAVTQKCRYCENYIPIRTAPNDEIIRLSYSDPTGKNYAHAKCHKERRLETKKPFSRPKPSTNNTQGDTWRVTAGVTFNEESLAVLSGLLFKLGALEADGSIADGEWSDEELTLLAQLVAAT